MLQLENIPQEHRYLIVRLCVIWALIAGSWVIITTTAPLVLKDIVGKAAAAEWLGIFTATTGVSGLIFCSALGYFSDRAGRMELINPWIYCWVFANICVAYAEFTGSVYALWVPRVVALSIPSTILHAFTSDLVQGSALLQTHGYLGAAFGTSMLFGSVACAVLGQQVSRSASLFLAVGLAVLAAGTSYTTNYPKHQNKNSHGSYMEAIRVVKRDPLLRNIILAFSLMRLANVNAFFMFVLFTNYRLGWGIFHTSMALGFAGFLGVLWQVFGVKVIVNRHQHTIKALYVVLVAAPFIMIAYASATTTLEMYIATFCGSVTGVGMSIFTSKIALLGAEDGIAGLALGLVGSLMNLLEIFCSLFYGKLLAWTIENCSVDEWCAGTPYYVNGALFGLVFFIVLYTDRRYGTYRDSWRGDVKSPTLSEARQD